MGGVHLSTPVVIFMNKWKRLLKKGYTEEKAFDMVDKELS